MTFNQFVFNSDNNNTVTKIAEHPTTIFFPDLHIHDDKVWKKMKKCFLKIFLHIQCRILSPTV